MKFRLPATYKIWFAGSVAWWIDAAVNLHYHQRAHALAALIIAVIFFAAGIFFGSLEKWR